jgi:Ca2+-binding RTX toxin-like protein
VARGAALALLAWLAAGAEPALAASSVDYTPSRDGSTLLVTGEDDDDVVSISVEGNTVTIADTGTGGISTADADCANAGGAVTCPLDPGNPVPPAGPISAVRFAGADLRGGNDSVTSSGPFALVVAGGAGDDVITGGPLGDDLIGQDGNDVVLGGEGDDFLFSGSGGPFATGGADLLDGQGGVDTVEYFRDLAVNVSLNQQADDGFPGEGDNAIAENVLAGGADDVLTGGPGANTLTGQGGNDLIRGLEGNDVLDGGDGDDGLDGGAQRDDLVCASGFDTAVVDPSDRAGPDCDRAGAEPAAGTATVNRRSKARVAVACPIAEANPCDGRLVLSAGEKTLGGGRFSIGPGLTRRVDLTLNRAGRERLARARGTLLADLEARTSEPIGTSVHSADLLVRRGRR